MKFLLKSAVFFFLLYFLISLVFPSWSFAAIDDPFDGDLEKAIDNEVQRKNDLKNDKITIFNDAVVRDNTRKTALGIAGDIVDIPGYSGKSTALKSIGQGIAMMYANPPASMAYWVQDTLANAGILAKPAYAQGIGFAGLSPLLGVWKASRNIAYLVLVLIMVAIGFMIIFRLKIDPKTVISVQAALPKIVLTLILITFSYAIAGFLIDVMYLSMAIIIDVMAKGMGGSWADKSALLQTQYMNGDWRTLGGAVFSGGYRSLDDLLKSFGGWALPGGAGIETSGVALGLKLFSTLSWTSFLGLSVGIPFLLLLIFTLGLLFTFLRLLILLFNSYLQVLIGVILGPIFLLPEAIPGRSAFSGWFTNLLANLVVFPATAAILIFAMFLTSLNSDASNPGVWTPPLVLGGAGQTFSAFLGIGILFLAPNLVATIKKLFNPKPALPVSIGTMFTPITGSFQTTTGVASQFYYMQTMPGLNRLFGGGAQGGHSGHKTP